MGSHTFPPPPMFDTITLLLLLLLFFKHFLDPIEIIVLGLNEASGSYKFTFFLIYKKGSKTYLLNGYNYFNFSMCVCIVYIFCLYTIILVIDIEVDWRISIKWKYELFFCVQLISRFKGLELKNTMDWTYIKLQLIIIRQI